MLGTNIAAQPEKTSAWRENLRTFRIATWLGWQIESNWADPLVFFIFAVLRPLSTALILVVMYQIIAGGKRADAFDYLFISNAFFVLVVQVMVGLSWTIIDDRENYKMLKYVYTSPARKFAYLIGRAVAKVLIGLFTTTLLLATGGLFLGLRLTFERIQWGWLALYFGLGLLILGGLGIALAGISLVIARHGGFIGEIVAGMLLLFSGAYFPPEQLPPVLKEISLALPITYWLEGMRRALSGGILMVNNVPISPSLARFDNWQLALILTVSALVSAGGSFFFYQWLEHVAKERGMIDRVTGF
jgi:ABC-2 type transport system permease protein